MTDVSTRTSRQAEWMQAPVGGGPITRPVVLGIVLLISLLFLVVPLALIVVSGFASGVGAFFKISPNRPRCTRSG